MDEKKKETLIKGYWFEFMQSLQILTADANTTKELKEGLLSCIDIIDKIIELEDDE